MNFKLKQLENGNYAVITSEGEATDYTVKHTSFPNLDNGYLIHRYGSALAHVFRGEKEWSANLSWELEYYNFGFITESDLRVLFAVLEHFNKEEIN